MASAKKPALDKKAAENLNLAVLRRLDPEVEEVLAVAGHVALYDFDQDNNQWKRKDVEGSLFLLKRRASPRFQFIILNKKSADNYKEDVLGGFVFEQNGPYIMYRNKRDEVVGIWFYDKEENDKVAGLFNRITSAFGGAAESPSSLSASSRESFSFATPTPMQPPAPLNHVGAQGTPSYTALPPSPAPAVTAPPQPIPWLKQPKAAPQTQDGPANGKTTADSSNSLLELLTRSAGASTAATPPPIKTRRELPAQRSIETPAAAAAEDGAIGSLTDALRNMTPVSGGPPSRGGGGVDGGAESTAGPGGGARQMSGLLTPSFLQGRTASLTSHPISVAPSTQNLLQAAPTPSGGGGNNGSGGTGSAGSAGSASAASPAAPEPARAAAQDSAGAAERARVRAALSELVKSDAFVDMFASALKSAGAL